MPAYVVNNDAGIAQGMSALAGALSPDPAKQMQAHYYAAMSRGADATAGYHQAQTQHVQQGTRGQQQLSEVFARGGNIQDQMAAAALGGSDFIRAVPGANVAVMAGQPGMTPTSAPFVMSQLGAGQAYNTTAPGHREDLSNRLAQAGIAAGPHYAQVRENARQFDQTPTPVLLDGQEAYLPRVEVIAGRGAPVPTQNSVQGIATQRLLNGQTVPNMAAILAPQTFVQGEVARNAPLNYMLGGELHTSMTGVRGVPEGAVLPPANSDAALGAALGGSLNGQNIPQSTIDAVATARRPPTVGVPRAARDIGPSEVKAMREAIQARAVQQVSGAAAVDPATLDQLTTFAAAEYQRTGDSAAAVNSAVQQLLGAAPNVQGQYNPFVSNNIAPGRPLGQPAPAPAGPGAAPRGGPPVMSSPADAARLPPGTQYATPDGRVFTR